MYVTTVGLRGTHGLQAKCKAVLCARAENDRAVSLYHASHRSEVWRPVSTKLPIFLAVQATLISLCLFTICLAFRFPALTFIMRVISWALPRPYTTYNRIAQSIRPIFWALALHYTANNKLSQSIWPISRVLALHQTAYNTMAQSICGCDCGSTCTRQLNQEQLNG